MKPRCPSTDKWSDTLTDTQSGEGERGRKKEKSRGRVGKERQRQKEEYSPIWKMKSCRLQEQSVTEEVKLCEDCMLSLVHDNFKSLPGNRTVLTIN